MNLQQEISIIYSGGPGSGRHPSADHWKKIGSQKGSNPGGVYKDHTDQSHYVKFYSKSERVQAEHLANLIYKSLGVQVPETNIVSIGGKEAIASKMIDGAKPLPEK